MHSRARSIVPPAAACLALLGACVEASDTADANERDAAASSAGQDAAGARNQRGDAGGAAEPADEPVSASPAACSEEVGSCPSTSFASWRSLIDAADFGPGAEFVATGGQAVLVKTGDGSFRVALLDYPLDERARYTSWPVATGARTPVAVDDPASDPHQVYLLACAQPGVDCRLLEADWRRGSASDPSSQLSDFHELPPLPGNFTAGGLVVDRDWTSYRAIPCVFGNGLLCFDAGSWREAIAPSPTLHLNAVASDRLYSLAVGDHGRWFTRQWTENTEALWREQPALGDITLSDVSANDRGGIILAEGRIQALVGQGTQTQIACALASPLLAFWLGPDAHVPSIVLTRNGEVLVQGRVGRPQPAPYCAFDRVPPAAIIATSFWNCGLARNERVLQAGALWGTNSCPVN